MVGRPPNKIPKETGEHLKRFIELQSKKFGRCLKPTMACSEKVIRAHSIQNARVLDYLESDGHVIALKLKVSSNGPDVVFERVGRNLATTFSGFCSSHDASIFRTLDTQPFTPTSDEQLFLLAYRSVARELHVAMESAVKVQTAYQEQVRRGVVPGNVPSEAGLIATQHIMNAYETHQYKATGFDVGLLERRFDGLEHSVVLLSHREPVLAVSSLFSLSQIEQDGDLVRCSLNVFPISQTETVAAFSYTHADAPLVRQALSRLVQSSGEYQKYELSKLIIDRVENFVLSPSCYARWGDTKKALILDAFKSNLLTDAGIQDHPELMLF